MRIPMDRLSPDVLERLIEEFVTREGTDYGMATHSFEDKCASVRRQLGQGDAAIVFDADTETCNIVTEEALREEESLSEGDR